MSDDLKKHLADSASTGMQGYTNMKYFSYHPEEGFGLHETAEEAKEAAEKALDFERDDACDGWSDYVDQICWGEIKQHVVETMSRQRTDEDTFISDDCAMVVDYGLVDV